MLVYTRTRNLIFFSQTSALRVNRKDLSLNQIYEYESLKNPQDSIKYLANTFNIGDDSDKAAIILDFYYYNLKFCKDQKFMPEKSSALFSILKQLHEKCISSPFIKLEEDYSFFKKLLMQHSVDRPPFSQRIFSFADVTAITEYVTNTYFRHYAMYKYAFTKRPKLDILLETPVEQREPSVEVVQELCEEKISDSSSGTLAIEANGNLLTGPVQPDLATPVGTIVVDDPKKAEPATPNSEVKKADRAPAPKNGESGPSTIQPPVKIPEPKVSDEPGTDPEAKRDGEGSGKTSNLTLEQEAAVFELRTMIAATLASKIDELQLAISSKMNIYDEQLMMKVKKVEEKEDERVKKDVKPKAGKDKK